MLKKRIPNNGIYWKPKKPKKKSNKRNNPQTLFIITFLSIVYTLLLKKQKQ